jgi:hypothetical protein
MTDRIERPIFYEGQVLAAQDLTATIENARGLQARHERYLHLWGISYGLELTGKDKQTAQGDAYKEVTLSAGFAVDVTGRELVVPEAEQLSEDLFDQLNVALSDKQAWYPVFLIGRDEPAPSTALSGTCNGTQSTRIVEGYELTFGRPGDELDWDKQDPPEVVEGPGNPGWRLLLGFVGWDNGIKRFINDPQKEVGGIGRRYAGVMADTVAARSGRLTLRTQPGNQAGKPAVMLDETDGGLFQFGLLTDLGSVTPVFSVNSKGDLTTAGKIVGALAAGGVQVESGIATDGMILPLPPGITAAQVAAGDAVVHTHISVRITEQDAPSTVDTWGPFPLEAYVDTDRRVHCKVRWNNLTTPIGIEDHPAACDYIVLASVRAK